ncbi:helix-turn-helix domain-containing protein [Clostridium gasigenes]|uniref:helix-turn-helix domain-containing protein n=1 Tax=Clostridium gasigenes TaxID=94869 RepID=UPI003396BC56
MCEERLNLNLTQEQLAEKVDISISYVGQIERGEINICLDTLITLANALRVSIDYLLNDSITFEEDNISAQLTQLLSTHTTPEKIMGLDILKTIFFHINKGND